MVIFGEEDLIIGYKNLKILITFASATLDALLEISYDEKASNATEV